MMISFFLFFSNTSQVLYRFTEAAPDLIAFGNNYVALKIQFIFCLFAFRVSIELNSIE